MDAARGSGDPLTLMAFDLDHFKRVNDSWGHAAGDRVLQRVARRSRMTLDPAHILGRTGGEEFLILLPATSSSVAAHAAEELRAAIESMDCSDIAPGLHLTISVGIAEWTNDEPLERLMARADAALYQSKTGGRNRVESA
jgi:diguanylate cyclase (GGDEF)-like protein